MISWLIIEILNQIELSANKEFESILICSSSECSICDGLISEIGDFVDIIAEEMSTFDFETFKIGNIVDKDIINLELDFQALFGKGIGESIKSQLNREIGIGLSEKLGLSALMNSPDI